MKRLHDLLWWHLGVEAVDLQEVDVRKFEVLEGIFNCVEDGGAAEAVVVDIVSGISEVRIELCERRSADAKIGSM